MIGGKLVFPGEGREEEEEEGETDGGGVSCWKGESSRGELEELDDDMVVVVPACRSDTSVGSCNINSHQHCGGGGHDLVSIFVK